MGGDRLPVGPADVEEAAARLDGVVHRTSVLTSATFDGWTGGRLFLKAECFQRSGAFKLRGAYNAIASLDPAVREAGVVAYSSGNHAQAVALASRLLGIDATIVMPEDAPGTKIAATRAYGAEIVTYDRYEQDRAAIAEEVSDQRGATLIPPYDHPMVVAGQGTVALELLDQVEDLDVIVVPVGGGGLISGCALVAAEAGVEVVGVEPEGRPAAREALAEGRPVIRPVARTIADGQQTPSIGDLPCRILLERVSTVVGVTDQQIIEAMKMAFERAKIVVEPSGASALAAVLAGVVEVEDRRAGVVLSGGNVGVDRFVALIDG